MLWYSIVLICCYVGEQVAGRERAGVVRAGPPLPLPPLGHAQRGGLPLPVPRGHAADEGGGGALDRGRRPDARLHPGGGAVRRHRAGAGSPRVPPRPPRAAVHARVREPHILRDGILGLPAAGGQGGRLGGLLAGLGRLLRHGRAGLGSSGMWCLRMWCLRMILH